MPLTLVLSEIKKIKKQQLLINTELCSFRPPPKLMTLVTQPLFQQVNAP